MTRGACCCRIVMFIVGAVAVMVAASGARAQTGIGACCLPTGGCINNAAATQCQAAGGIFLDGQTCAACDQTGACCFTPAGGGTQCAVMTTFQCAAQPQRVFVGGTCQPNPCPTTTTLGVCCDSAGQCNLNVLQAQCPAPRIWYNLATCSPNPCPPTGACCTAAGGCTQTIKSECPAAQWYPNTSCSPNPCGQGVCCELQTGACFPSAQANCPTTVGIWIPNGSCATAPCPRGACCLQDGTCFESNRPECRHHGGHFLPNTPCVPSPCPRTGACCISTVASGCAVVPSTQCPTGSQFFPGQTCVPNPCPNIVGACCCPRSACFIAPQSQCVSTFTTGTTALTVNCHWFANQTCATAPCPPVGACCTPNGCFTTTLHACAPPAHWFANTSCTPNPCPATGACCTVDGQCIIITGATACNGKWYPGQGCVPNPCPRGGCCHPCEGACTITTQAECALHGGHWLGVGVPCDPLPAICRPRRGACCHIGSPVCVITTASHCQGFWFPNKSCAPNPCCPPDYDGRGSVNVSAIFAFLRDWFAGCP